MAEEQGLSGGNWTPSEIVRLWAFEVCGKRIHYSTAQRLVNQLNAARSEGPLPVGGEGGSIGGDEPSSDASASASPAADETTLGHVIWHSSDEDGGPDVGLSLGLGKGRVLWLGEMSNRALEEAEIDLSRYSDGWWLTLYQPGRTTIIGAVPDSYEARDAFDEIAAAVRSAAGQSLNGLGQDGSSHKNDEANPSRRAPTDCQTSGGGE